MSLDSIVDTTPVEAASLPGVSPVVGQYPGPDLVAAAAALFNREVTPDRVSRFAPHGVVRGDGSLLPGAELTVQFFGEDRLQIHRERVSTEGPRWRIEVSPGSIAVRNSDPVVAERAAERAIRDRRSAADALAENLLRDPDYQVPDPAPARGIRVWSPRSRSRMVERMAQLDYTPMLGSGPLALVTFTYPGDWQTVAPGAPTCHRHLLAFRKRFERRYKIPLVAVWKREFQRRGAPHYHLLMAVPDDPGFREWVSEAWAEVVGHPDPVQRARHVVAGTGVDLVEGARYRDPKRAAVYFSKHGAFAAKEYQNSAPDEWDGSVGRFWGYWHLEKAVAAVEVAPDVARAVVRTARRYADAHAYQITVTKVRKVITVDKHTGEIGFRWRRRRTKVWVKRLRRSSGYLVVNDGPVFASQLARAAHVAVMPRSGRGPVGYLP